MEHISLAANELIQYIELLLATYDCNFELEMVMTQCCCIHILLIYVYTTQACVYGVDYTIDDDVLDNNVYTFV